ncbi:MAG: MORN repeat-containing protein, partial [Saprospiraceae bacterium]
MKYYLLFVLFAIVPMLADAQCISGDCKNGKGTYLYPSGAKYTGDFKNGEINGVGVCYYTDNSKYSGEWKHRYPDGRGTKTYSDGTKRTGLWLKGKPVDETGKILEDYIAHKKEEKLDDGTNIQSGCLSGDCKNGAGILAYPDGSKFEGNFVEGKYDGTGTFYFANGDKYVGDFKNNFPNGKGTRFLKNGETETGEWSEGEFIGSSLTVSGKVGCIQGNCENGSGTYIYKEGSAKYVGSFKDKHPHGKGTCTYANGDRYLGEWADGAFDGQGVLFLHDGTEINGFWKAGEYQGKNAPSDYQPVANTDTPEQPTTAPPVTPDAPENAFA